MGRETPTRSSYETAKLARGITGVKNVTRAAEQEAGRTGKLRITVDPSAYDTIRYSLIRLDPTPDDKFVVTVGCPMDIESICDTTGSMGGNVDVAMRVLPDTYDLISKMLPGYDPQLALGIFGDVSDRWVLQRPQFEMTSDKLVSYLNDMVPERRGGDAPEDPQFGLFGAAYLTAAYTNRIGLKGYHFTISDAPGREYGLSTGALKKVFGRNVYDLVSKNGYQINPDHLPSTKELVRHLLKRTHAFFLQVGAGPDTRRFWKDIYGANRVVAIPDTEYLPHVKAVIIGLTEGTIGMSGVRNFLVENNLSAPMAESIAKAVANIPLFEQRILREKLVHPVPKAGDIFKDKADLWPVDAAKTPEELVRETPEEPPQGWL